MNIKVIALGALLGFSIALAPSCGPAKGDCSAANCNGCCAADGKCTEAIAQNATACGASGSECKACQANESCVTGVCTPSTSNTNTDAGTDAGGTACNGVGCRTATGTCLMGTTNTNCGTGGNACMMCPSGQMCTNGACVMPPAVDAGSLGAACTSNTDCADLGMAGECKTATATGNAMYTGGYCTKPCMGGECGQDGTCITLAPYGEDQICLLNCTAQKPCRDPGYTCYPLEGSPNGVCWLDPLPMVDAGDPPPDNLIGSPCMTDGECNDAGYDKGFCFPPTTADGGASGWTDGYCLGDCNITDCGNTAKCFNLSGGGKSFPSCLDLCAAPLAGQSDCRAGYVCDGYRTGLPDGGSAPATDGICWPACDAPGRGCPMGSACDAGYCE